MGARCLCGASYLHQNRLHQAVSPEKLDRMLKKKPKPNSFPNLRWRTEMLAVVADRICSALVVCAKLTGVRSPSLCSLLIPDSDAGVMVCRSCNSVKRCNVADGGQATAPHLRRSLILSGQSVREVLRTRGMGGLKKSDSRFGSAGDRAGNRPSCRRGMRLVGPFAARFPLSQFLVILLGCLHC
jgi:hypothetical protein